MRLYPLASVPLTALLPGARWVTLWHPVRGVWRVQAVALPRWLTEAL